MNASNLFGATRGSFLIRLAAAFFILSALVWLGLPHAQNAYQDYKAGKPLIHSGSEQTNTFSEDLEGSNPLSPFPTPSSVPTHGDVENVEAGTAPACLDLPGANKVMVILKTGATELYQKLPVHFVTTFTCVEHFSIYSDLDQDFGGVHIHDAIATVSEGRQKEHEDFKLYREIAEWWEQGQDMGKLKGDSGWNLDKWKFLPMFHDVFSNAPSHIEWFFMMEADTSISWLNLLLWIQKLDSSKPYYMGAQNMLGDLTFGHGGSGVLISRKAADMLEAARNKKGHQAYDEAWEDDTAMTCCGDAVVSRAFLEVNIPLTGSWPIIQGETVDTVDFTNTNWCQPPVTWHHVDSFQVDEMWRFERNWAEKHGWETPYLYRDIFEYFVGDNIAVNRTLWNNLSNDQKFVSPNLMQAEKEEEFNHGKPFSELEEYERASVESFDACAQACRQKEHDCLQWMYQQGRCYLGRDVRHGMSDERESEHWESGWLSDRMEGIKKERNQRCETRWIS